MHFDLIDLRLFINTLDAGNITAGAERSHLSLAAASARIRAMETSLGTPLFNRTRRGINPTPAGSAMGQHARRVLQQVDNLQFDLAQFAQGRQGQVRLLCNTAALTEYLPELLAHFLHRFSGVDLDVQERPSQQSVQDLREGKADLAIVSDAVDTSGLQTLAFRDDPLVLVMPRHHPLTQAARPDFIASLDHRHVCLGAHSALAQHLDEQARRSSRRLAVRVRAEGFDGLIRMVAHGAGVGVVPRAAAQRGQGHLDFVIAPLSEPWAARKLVLCAADFAGLPGYARGLVEVLQDN